MQKWRKDPGKFYVDNEHYPRAEQYGLFCANTSAHMNDIPLDTLTEATEWCAPLVKDFYTKFSDKKGYGDVRPIEIMEPTLKHQHQQQVIQHTLRRLLDGKLPEHEYMVNALLVDHNGNSIEVPLTSVKPLTHEGSPYIELHHFHSPQEESTDSQNGTYIAELLWSKASRLYRAAKTGRMGQEMLTAEQRQDAAKRCYWCFSHYMPLKYGSATTGMIILEHLADQVGMEIGKPKRDVDINIEALLKDENRFAREFNDMFRSPPSMARSSTILD